jgi:hypothetical protein
VYLAVGLTIAGTFGTFQFLTYYLQVALRSTALEGRPGVPARDRRVAPTTPKEAASR